MATTEETGTSFRDVVETPEELAALYGPPTEMVRSKVIDRLDRHCRDWIARSPFVLVATSDASGRCDVSPKGGPAGFVRVLDERRLAIPDAPGNRLVDSLTNLVANGHAGLIFLVPGMEETLRVNGRAALTRDPELLESLGGTGKPPRIAIGLEVEEAYLHCAKAFKRSALWQPDAWPSTDGLARPARIWKDHMALSDTVEELEAFLEDDYANNLQWR